ncbi:MAG: mucoidy inhibitor MuiA family protein [Gilliamella sp.]|uniref:mucoidy inhibitor MuiA family protein n=1 Tax=Gilliamella sp. TaxID=1891236 RepID=UPI00262B5578|nr:mucoidy inhibitor MuiA family protein [Gilliamella sp.]MCO6552917.1 mucoidy inhibitor MuiA family protein [Gilliamella sp.]
MKIQKLAFLIAFASSSVFANNNVTLNKVTLFLQGAELQGQSTVSLTKGESEILLTGIANGVKANSINVGFGNDANVKVLSTSFNDNYIDNSKENQEIQSLLEELQRLQEKHDTVEIELKAVSEQVTLLQGNRLDLLVKGANDDLNGMQSALDFIKTNLVTVLNEQNKLQKQLDEIDEQILQCQDKIDKQKASAKNTTNAITVKVYSDKDITLPVTLSYVTNKAGWAPIYDVRVADINSPLQLTYKADIYQNTGLDWQNVDFSLSTSNPSEGIIAPDLVPWYIDIYTQKGGLLKSDGNMSAKKSTVALEDADADVYIDDNNDNALINTLDINTRFEVKLPYTIKSNSNNNILTLQNKEVEAKYHYIAIPKLDSNVYLQAQIVDWDRLNLLPGKSTVFFNGNYIGESFITTKDLKETLDISLGKDKNIFIARNRNVNETSKPSLFGNDISQKYAYTIGVKNAKTLPIDIVVYDQLPIIVNKSVSLDDARYDGATYNKETGELIWEFKLNPSENKNLNLSFKLTYPKDKVNDIIGL